MSRGPGRRLRIPSLIRSFVARSGFGGQARLWRGGIAQLGERLLCKQEVIGSIPFASTTSRKRGHEAESLIREDPSSVLDEGAVS